MTCALAELAQATDAAASAHIKMVRLRRATVDLARQETRTYTTEQWRCHYTVSVDAAVSLRNRGTCEGQRTPADRSSGGASVVGSRQRCLAPGTVRSSQPSFLICLISSSRTPAALSASIWQVPAASWPPPPYLRHSAPMLVFEVRFRIDLPIANTTFWFARPHITCIEMLVSGNSAYRTNRFVA